MTFGNYEVGEYIFYETVYLNEEGIFKTKKVRCEILHRHDDSNGEDGTIHESNLNSLHRMKENVWHEHMLADHEIDYMFKRSEPKTYEPL